jgi:hypothetical protein
MDCKLVDECCHEISARIRETYRSREAQRKADEATLQRLIEVSKERLTSASEAALQRLQANNQPSGMRVRVFMGYTPLRGLILRRRLGRAEMTKERTIWQVPYAQGTLLALLMSDGLLYDDWCVQRSNIDSSPLLARLSSINSLDTNKRVGLFVNPNRPRIQRHVDQLVKSLGQLGT